MHAFSSGFGLGEKKQGYIIKVTTWMNSCYSGEELTGFFALEQEKLMRSYL